MRFIKAEAANFASYEKLDFGFANLGLSLVYGPTGSGKSTLLDLVCWVLYGVTAKGGSVDEVRNWTKTNVPTKGTLELEINNAETMVITRIRGSSSSNDLFWTSSSRSPGSMFRGKDLKDTQKLLEQKLGISRELFFASAYFNEFTRTGAFFTASSKDKRTVFEQIANLSYPQRLNARAGEFKKESGANLRTYEDQLARQSARLSVLRGASIDLYGSSQEYIQLQNSALQRLQTKKENFEQEKASKIQVLETKSEVWETRNKAEIDKTLAKLESITAQLNAATLIAESDVTGKACPTCGGISAKDQKKINKVLEAETRTKYASAMFESFLQELKDKQEAVNPHLEAIETAKLMENHYDAELERERAKPNPFDAQIKATAVAIKKAEIDVKKSESELAALSKRVSALSQLQELSAELRGVLLQNTIKEIEVNTNRYLETYFDAEFLIGFGMDGSDGVDVSIAKSGYNCAYTQLSKGQRQLLKLSFVVSVMEAAANNAGTHFSTIFMDESLDGLDSDLKIKAFSLLEELSTKHEGVVVVDHSEAFQQLFSNKYHVTLNGDVSSIEVENE